MGWQGSEPDGISPNSIVCLCSSCRGSSRLPSGNLSRNTSMQPSRRPRFRPYDLPLSASVRSPLPLNFATECSLSSQAGASLPSPFMLLPYQRVSLPLVKNLPGTPSRPPSVPAQSPYLKAPRNRIIPQAGRIYSHSADVAVGIRNLNRFAGPGCAVRLQVSQSVERYGQLRWRNDERDRRRSIP